MNILHIVLLHWKTDILIWIKYFQNKILWISALIAKKRFLGFYRYSDNKKSRFPSIYKENDLTERAGIRTPDNLIKSQVLYRLSYTPICLGPESNQ